LDLQQKTYERLASLGGVVAGSRVLEAETARAQADVAVQRAVQTLVNLGLPITYEEVRQEPGDRWKHKLQFLGLPEAMTHSWDRQQTTSSLIPLTAPRDGTVVTRNVVAGEVVDTLTTLFTVADTSRVWLMLNVPLEAARYVRIRQQVLFQPDGADAPDQAEITWISTDVDPDTRTVPVRAELPNDDGHLRNETFGAGDIILREEQDAIVVPNGAVHWEGCCHVVFVRDKDFLKRDAYKVFHTRMVRPGVTSGDYTEMIAGVLPGEVVVTKGSGVLRAELLKGNLGAG
jgi:cobalt-zinc-cadmium efflux system membrane fusion protein